MFMVSIDESKCDGCGECVEACPASVLVLQDGKCHVTNPTDCLGCETCVTVCPNGAPTLQEL
ncbi:MAG: 4Fe-4S binding protein [Thermoanaerobacterales bacterium]|nr:4Fe-4S binding protein [Bacillota bacterium]MDI6907227.1 4Fe-4S binding protein [Thermoanaerobacterales bacterium]